MDGLISEAPLLALVVGVAFLIVDKIFYYVKTRNAEPAATKCSAGLEVEMQACKDSVADLGEKIGLLTSSVNKVVERGEADRLSWAVIATKLEQLVTVTERSADKLATIAAKINGP